MVRELEDDDHKAFIHLDPVTIVEGPDSAGRLVVSSTAFQLRGHTMIHDVQSEGGLIGRVRSRANAPGSRVLYAHLAGLLALPAFPSAVDLGS